MTQKLTRRLIALAATGFCSAAALVIACDDDSTVGGTGGPDASPDVTRIDSSPGPVADTGTPDTGTTDPDAGDGAAPVAPWAITAGFFNGRSQPLPAPDPTDAGDAGTFSILIPSNLLLLVPAAPARVPEVAIPGPFAPLGCTSFKFPTQDPHADGGPNFPAGDFGKISVNGFTGGDTPAGPIPKPIDCTRSDLIPDSGFFGYTCNAPPLPATGFIAKTDNLTLSVAGGADSPAFTVTGGLASPIDNLVVQQNLFNMPPTSFDGATDLVLNYNCGATACASPAPLIIAVIIETSDGDPDGGITSPFELPPPAAQSGRILCTDLYAANATSYTVKKELLANLPNNWKHARITIATANAGQGASANGVTGSMFAGDAVFGVTHR